MLQTITGLLNRMKTRGVTAAVGLCITAAASSLGGCGLDSFMFDQSRTGRFEYYPTTIPILERIDVIERGGDFFANAAPVESEDLMPRDLVYYIYPGDQLVVGIYELHQANVWDMQRRRVDAAGNLRIPELGDVRAAGLTVEEFESRVRQLLDERVMRNPQVDIYVEQGGALRYTVYGYVRDPGVFGLENPNLRLVDALAIAGGVPPTTDRVFVIRQVVLSDEAVPGFERNRGSNIPQTQPQNQQQPNIEELIERLENEDNRTRQPGGPSDAGDAAEGGVSPGMLQQDTQPTVDIDELEPVRQSQEQPPIDIEDVRPQRPADDGSGDSFIYVEERGEWVRVPGGQDSIVRPPSRGAPDSPQANLTLDRIIEIDYQALARGDSSQNIVVRPNDQIYVDGPEQGFVYIEGEILRPGVYGLPTIGRLTLSRLVAAAGGLPQTAVPTRVDLIRVVGPNLEAAIRMDLAAIRQRTEPDVYMLPNDHVIIGTNFFATPMAVIRNGFRATYGFGFLLDRNFGNDVFGAPPGEGDSFF